MIFRLCILFSFGVILFRRHRICSESRRPPEHN